MGRQARIPGTEGKKVPDNVRDAIVELKKKKDARIRAKTAEKKAQDAANTAAKDAGYKAGDVVELPDETPPLKFEVKQADSKIVVRVLDRDRNDETQEGDE